MKTINSFILEKLKVYKNNINHDIHYYWDNIYHNPYFKHNRYLSMLDIPEFETDLPITGNGLDIHDDYKGYIRYFETYNKNGTEVLRVSIEDEIGYKHFGIRKEQLLELIDTETLDTIIDYLEKFK